MNLSGKTLHKHLTVLCAGLALLAGCASVNGRLTSDTGFHRLGRIALLPIENRSSSPAPLDEIARSFSEKLKGQGFDLLEEDGLAQFMERRRMRDTGGLNSDMARAFKEEAGVAGVLITSLELYHDNNPPQIALSARLVSTGERPEIVWIDSIGSAGDDAPGLLGLGLIEDQKVLLDRATAALAGSLAGFVSGRERDYDENNGKFKPKADYVSTVTGVGFREVVVNFALRRLGREESVSPAKIDVSLSAPSPRKVTVEYAVTGGTAETGRDYSLKSGTLIFGPGELSKEIDIRVLDDKLYRGDRTIAVTLSKPVNAVLGKQTVHTYTITDNDPAPAITFTSAGQDVQENGGSATVTMQLSSASGKDVVVPFTVSGTAQEGADYSITPAPLFIKAGETSGTIIIKPKDDHLSENTETAVVTLGKPENAALGERPVHTVTVTDNDPAPLVSFVLQGSQEAEGKSPAKIEVSLSAASGKPATVEYAVTGGTAETGRDHTLKTTTLAFEPGETAKSIDLGIIDDNLHEDSETIEATLINPVNAVLGKQTVHTYTIIDNDPAPTITFTSAGQDVQENGGSATVTMQLSSASGKDVVVPFTVSGTAVDGKHYRVMTPNPVTIKAGATTAGITLALLDNNLYEDSKTTVVALGTPENAALGERPVHTVTVTDNDPAPLVSFVLQGSQEAEGKGPAKIEVSLSAASGKPATVEYAVTGGTAETGRDHTLKTTTLAFEPGETAKSIDLGIIDDNLHEDSETIEATLINPVNAVLGKQTVHTYTIIDNDPAPTITFTSAGQDVQENGGSATVTMQLSSASGKDVVVPFTVSGTAVDGKHYRVMTPNPVTIKAGATTAGITLALLDNNLYEDSKTTVVALGTPENAALGERPVHTVTVTDNDPAPLVSFVLQGSQEAEGKGPAKIEVSLSAASGKPATVEYAVTGGTAETGRDHTLKTTTLAFEPGETAKSIDLGIIDDNLHEDSETIEATLINPVNAVLGKQTVHTYTIIDNDPAPTITFTSAGQDVQENGGSATVTMQLSSASGKDVVVPFTVSGTAVDGKHYRVMTPNPVTIKAGATTAGITLALLDNNLYEDSKTTVVALGKPENAALGERPVHRLTIFESGPPPVVAFSMKESGGDEGVTPARLDVALSSVVGRRTTVQYAVTGGTAANSSDYAQRNGTLVFEPGETAKSIDLGIIDDNLHEDSETIEVTLANPVNTVLGKQSVHTYTIIENDVPPAVSFAATVSRGKESVGRARLTASLSTVSSKNIRVEYAVTGGTAVSGRDYALKNGTLDFKPGETAKNIDIGIIDDNLHEDSETIEVTLANPVNAVLGKQTVHTYTIVENDPTPSVTFALQAQEVREDSGEVAVTAKLSAISGKDVLVPFTVSGTAVDGKNYRVSTPNPFIIRAGERTGIITVVLVDNKLYENNNVISVSIGTAVNATPGARAVHRVTVVESDPPPAVGFGLKDSTEDEGARSAKIEVSLSAASGRRSTVEYAVRGGGTAANGRDDTLKKGMLVFDPGERSKVIDIGGFDDRMYGNDRTIEVTLSNPVNAVLGSLIVHRHRVIAKKTNTPSNVNLMEEPEPAVNFSMAGSEGYERKNPAKISLSLSLASRKKVAVEYAVTGGSAASDRDYTLKNGVVVFNPGETFKTINIRIIDDRKYNDNKTIEVTLSNPVNAVLGKQTVHTYTIIDNDPAPAITFTSAGQDVQENGGSATVTMQLSSASGKDVVVPFTVSGTAQEGADYSITPAPLFIKAGETSGTIIIKPKDDHLSENTETAVVTLGKPENAALGERPVHTVTVTDNDPAPLVSFVLQGSQEAEGKSPAKIEVSLSAASGKPATVEYAVTGGTAETGRDHTLKTTTLAFEPGETAKSIDLGIIDDNLHEDSETIEATLINPVNAVLGKQTVHTCTIIDNDPAPTITFTSAGQDVQENGGSATVTMQLSSASGKDVVVPFTVSGTAVDGKHYRVMTPNPVTIKAGATTAGITLALLDNNLYEDSKTTVVALGTPENAALGERPVHTVTVTDNDPAPLVSFVLQGSQEAEGKGPAKIEVSLSAASGKPATVEYAVTGGTAETGRDHTLKTTTLAFEPGETAKSIDLGIIDDNLHEDSETIEATLINPVNAVLGKQTVHTCTIIDNDPAPAITFTSAGQDVQENGGSATVTMQLSSASGKDVVVPFTVSGTAQEGADYSITPAPLFIKAGETSGTIIIKPKDDHLSENTETAVVTLGKPENAALGERPVHTVTVTDNDPAPLVSFVLQGSQEAEGKSPAKIEVSLSAASGKPATVEYAVTGGTAETGRDHTLKTTTLAFEPGETAKSIDLGIIDDNLHEDSETIEATLINPVNAVLGKQTVHTCTIIDNDPAPTITFTSAGQDVQENGGSATVTMQLSSASGKDVVVPFTVSGTAVDGKHYRVMTPNPVTIKAGATTAGITLALLDNNLYEDSKTTVVALGTPENAALGERPVHTVTVTDNDPAPLVSFVLQGSQEAEGKGPAKIEVSLSAASGKPATVEYAVTGGTAETGRDHTLKTTTLAFEPGETAKSIDLGIIDDNLHEDSETIEATLINPVNAVLGKQTVHTYTIIDNDPAPTITFTSAGQDVQENGGSATVTMQLSSASGKDVIVPFTVSGTAVDGKHYRVMTPNPVTIKAGATTAGITLALLDNNLYEDSKTTVVALGTPENAALGERPVHTVTVTDNDPAPLVSFMLQGSQEAEGKGPAKIEVSLSAASGKPATVEYAVTGGTAETGRDHTLKTTTLAFEPGETAKSIDLGIIDDNLHEDSETIEATLINPVNAVLGKQTVHTCTIIDNDPAPAITFTSAGQDVQENGGSATVTMQLSSASGKDVVVPFTVSGTAVDGKHYRVMTPNPVTIKAGATTAGVSSVLMNNTLQEDNKTIVATLGTSVNATPGEVGSHTVTVIDDDAPRRIAIMPFTNSTDRKYAGEIMAQHFLRELFNGKHFSVIEPGLIKEKLLDYRIIMYDGISLTDADLIADELKADLILSGKVLDYQDHTGVFGKPKVGFSLLLINRNTREVVWSSSSRNEGDDAVYLFDWGRINTAHALAAEMARAVEKMAKQK